MFQAKESTILTSDGKNNRKSQRTAEYQFMIINKLISHKSGREILDSEDMWHTNNSHQP